DPPQLPSFPTRRSSDLVGVKVLERDAAKPLRPHDFNLSIQAHQRGRSIAAKRRPALLAAGRHVAQVAIFFNAEPTGPPPLQRLRSEEHTSELQSLAYLV